MKPKKFTTNTNGQSILEYMLLLGIVTFVLFAMNPLIRRGIQSLIKVTADEIGTQQNGEQNFNSQSGFLVESLSSMNSVHSNTQRQRLKRFIKNIDEQADLVTNATSNLGFTEDR